MAIYWLVGSLSSRHLMFTHFMSDSCIAYRGLAVGHTGEVSRRPEISVSAYLCQRHWPCCCFLNIQVDSCIKPFYACSLYLRYFRPCFIWFTSSPLSHFRWVVETFEPRRNVIWRTLKGSLFLWWWESFAHEWWLKRLGVVAVIQAGDNNGSGQAAMEVVECGWTEDINWQ